MTTTFCLVVGVAWTVLEWNVCRRMYCGGPYSGVGFLGLTLAPVMWFTFRRGGTQRLELRIDREGFVAHGVRVPWEAVMSILWRAGSADHREHIESACEASRDTELLGMAVSPSITASTVFRPTS